MSDTLESFFETGVSFLNNRQRKNPVLDENDCSRVRNIFSKMDMSDNELFKLMYRYFKCLNELCIDDEKDNGLLKMISEVYLEKESHISQDIMDFCKSNLAKYRSSKMNITKIRENILTTINRESKTQKSIISKNNSFYTFMEVISILNKSHVDFVVDGIIGLYLYKNEWPLNVENIPLMVSKSDLIKCRKSLAKHGYLLYDGIINMDNNVQLNKGIPDYVVKSPDEQITISITSFERKPDKTISTIIYYDDNENERQALIQRYSERCAKLLFDNKYISSSNLKTKILPPEFFYYIFRFIDKEKYADILTGLDENIDSNIVDVFEEDINVSENSRSLIPNTLIRMKKNAYSNNYKAGYVSLKAILITCLIMGIGMIIGNILMLR
jgi:hypothetical protein